MCAAVHAAFLVCCACDGAPGAPHACGSGTCLARAAHAAPLAAVARRSVLVENPARVSAALLSEPWLETQRGRQDRTREATLQS